MDARERYTSGAQHIAGAVVALGFLALVAIMFWRATEPNQNFPEIWAACGTIVGIAAGGIPAYFFTRERAHSASLERMNTTLAGIANKADFERVMKENPGAVT